MATIEVTKDIQELLQALKKEHPALDETEILKRALADYRKRELQKRWQEWEESLPTLELSEAEQDELAEALAEADREPGRIMTLEELLKEAQQD